MSFSSNPASVSRSLLSRTPEISFKSCFVNDITIYYQCPFYVVKRCVFIPAPCTHSLRHDQRVFAHFCVGKRFARDSKFCRRKILVWASPRQNFLLKILTPVFKSPRMPHSLACSLHKNSLPRFCAGGDLNPHGIAPVRPSSVCVYQFRHLRTSALLYAKIAW